MELLQQYVRVDDYFEQPVCHWMWLQKSLYFSQKLQSQQPGPEVLH